MIVTLCPDRETLLRYSLGMLPEEQREPLDSHLDSCPDCQAMIVTLDDADDTAIGRLRTPLSGESVLAEPQLQDALAAAMGMSPRAPEAADMPEMLGEYRLIAELGRGGMGRVYKALHTKLDRIVAVKVSTRPLGDGDATNRFAREMKAVGRLAHPNIVHAHDAREIDGTAVLIMELVDGLDLAEIVRRCAGVPALAGNPPLPPGEGRGEGSANLLSVARKGHGDEGRATSQSSGDQTPAKAGTPALAIPDACELIRQTALALQCAHENGLVHRDIKPSNIMLARSGEVKLLDLGLARFFAESGADASSASHEEMTGTGQAMGTADYMAPEQASDSRTVDIRADIYSLGCTFYKLLTGRAPFSGPEYRTALDKMNAHIKQAAPPIRQIVPEVPEQLSAVLNRMLAKEPAARFATPAEVAEAVAPFCAAADLVTLLNRAESCPPLPPGEGRGEGGLNLSASKGAGAERDDNSLPSPSGRGAGGEGIAAARPRRWKFFAGQIVALALIGGLCFALGILITIKKNGKTYQIEPPPNSRTLVDQNGNANVNIGENKKAGSAPAVINHAAEVSALQGTWKVVSSSGTYMHALQSDVFARKNPEVVRMTTRIVVGSNWVKILGPHAFNSTFDYQLNTASTPRKIDLRAIRSDYGDTYRGIYELAGDQLKICIACASGRPTEYFAEFGSQNELLVLQRVSARTDYADGRPIEGDWKVETVSGGSVALSANAAADPKQAEDAKLVLTAIASLFVTGRDVSISGTSFTLAPIPKPSHLANSRYFDVYSRQVLPYAYDPRTSPMPITLGMISPGGVCLPGIYELNDDRLTICFSVPRPDFTQPEWWARMARTPAKLEAGATVMRVVLNRVRRAAETTASPAANSTANQNPVQRPKIDPDPPTVRVTQPIVCNVCDYEEYPGRIEKGLVEIHLPDQGASKWIPADLNEEMTVREGDVLGEYVPYKDRDARLQKAVDEVLRARQIKDALGADAAAKADAALKRAREELERAKRDMPRLTVAAPTSATPPTWAGDLGHKGCVKVVSPVSGTLCNLHPYSPKGYRARDQNGVYDAIDPSDSMLVTFDVPEQTVLAHRRMPDHKREWELSLPVVVALADDKSFCYRGKVVSIAEGIDPKTHTQRWQAVVPNKDGLFVPGMSVRVRVITSEPHKAILVPHTACFAKSSVRDRSEWDVYVISDRNVVQYRVVKPGRCYDEFLSLDGVNPDDRIVVDGDMGPVGQNPPWQFTVVPEMVTNPPPHWAAISVAPAVSVARPIAREVSDYADYTGRIDRGEEIKIKAPITGTVNSHFNPEKPFKQGDLLADMVSEADWQKISPLKNRLADAQQTIERIKSPTSHFAHPQDDLALAEEQVKTTRAELDAALRTVKFIKILAPCSGKIGSHFLRHEYEMQVDAGVDLFSIISRDSVYAVFDVDERTVIQLRRQMADRLPDWELSRTVLCGLNGDTGFPLRGKVTSVDSELDPKTGTQHWHVLLPNKDGVLLPGMFVRVRLLTTDPHKALLVPERSLGSDQGRKFVFVVGDQNFAERRDVEIGQLQDDGLRVVAKGLGGNDRVILDPSKVTAGMTVKPEEPAPATPAAQPQVR